MDHLDNDNLRMDSEAECDNWKVDCQLKVESWLPAELAYQGQKNGALGILRFSANAVMLDIDFSLTLSSYFMDIAPIPIYFAALAATYVQR